MIPFCLIALSLIFSCVGFAAGPAIAADPPQLQMAPVNPEFSNFMLHGRSINMVSSQGRSLGYVPSPLDRSYLTSAKNIVEIQKALPLPSSYDLRTTGKLTSVRNQGSCGACWTFGTMASLESSLMPGETRDFSENNLNNLAGFDLAPCLGGNADMSTAYLMRWDGPVDESDDPYGTHGITPSPSGLSVRKHTENIIFLPQRSGPLDNDTIKTAVMTYGALYASILWSDAAYNSATYAYNYTGGPYEGGHAIAIVGWDDTFDRNKFSPAAAGNGAFIMRNSWGTSWGESGYFYISYYDTTLGYRETAAFATPENPFKYGRVYSYDPLGTVSAIGYGSNTAWFANEFTAQANEKIGAVSFYNAGLNSAYEIYVYTNLSNVANPRSGTLAASLTGTLANAGYLTVPLNSRVSVTSGQLFSVVVKLTTPGYNFPVPLEKVLSGYSSAATASPGQSFISSSGTSWTDMTTINSSANVCLKAYSTSAKNPKDFNGDGSSDILWQNSSTEELAVWYMNGITMNSAVFLNPSKAGEANWRFVDLGDFNSDGKTDLLWQNNLNGDMVVWYMNGVNMSGSSYLNPINAGSGNTNWKAVATGDFKGPNGNDILWQNSSTEELAVWYMNGITMTSAVMLNPSKPGAANWKIVGLGDFNTDGNTDILWQNSVSGDLAVWYMNGINMTGAVMLNPANAGAGSADWKAVTVGDYNLDGNPDILWQNSVSGESVVWYLNGINLISSTSLNPASAGSTDWKIRK